MINNKDSRHMDVAWNPDAKSAVEGVPGFIARPDGEPVYYGFPILDDVNVEGFKLGMITNFEADHYSCGDAFVVAPDNSRCGLIWTESSSVFLEEVSPLAPDRWGVWRAGFRLPMTNRANAMENLRSIVPLLTDRWSMWKEQFHL
jgi:hypothetical protein